MPGQLRVTGTLSLAQFWPTGTSDADTTTLQLTIGANAFEFREHASLPWRPQPALESAKVRGRQGTKPVLNNAGKVKIRLQGIDAPELHYRPALPSRKDRPDITDSQREKFKDFNEDYRQFLGESATVALHTELAAHGGPDLAVEARSFVDEPNDIFDVYGRLVGNVVVANNGLDINHWLLENGWVFPSYYNSMSAAEIKELNALWDRGWRVSNRIWDHFDYRIPAFQPGVVFRKTAGGADSGPVTIPKIFRRQALWFAMKQSGIVTGSVVKYLRDNPEQVQITPEVLEQGTTSAPWYNLAEFIENDGTLNFDPEMLVFKEGASTLVDANNQKITAWQ
jgi:endonuclease YncB( thermonuclease family)